MLKNTYNTIGNSRIDRIRNSCSLYISSAVTTTYNLSQSDELIEELTLVSRRSLTAMLDECCNYALRISAVTVYATDGRIYSSSRITDAPSIQELHKNAEISAFLDGEKDSFLSLRTDTIADIYDNSLYPEEMGIVTCCQKVYSNNEVVGYIFSDILPSDLYSYFADGILENSISFITMKDTYFMNSANENYDGLLTGKANGYFVYSSTAEEGFSVIAFESKSSYNIRIISFAGLMLVVSIGLLIGLHFMAKKLAKNVTTRLDSFLDRMDSEAPPL